MHEAAATVLLPLLAPVDVEVRLRMMSPVPETLALSVNGQPLGSWHSDATAPEQAFRVPARLLFRGDNVVTIAVPANRAAARGSARSAIGRSLRPDRGPAGPDDRPLDAERSTSCSACYASSEVTTLVDVRRFPASRRYPHFNGPALARPWPRRASAYRHEPDMGGRREPVARLARTRPGASPPFAGTPTTWPARRSGPRWTDWSRSPPAPPRPAGDHVRGGGAVALPSPAHRGRAGGRRRGACGTSSVQVGRRTTPTSSTRRPGWARTAWSCIRAASPAARSSRTAVTVRKARARGRSSVLGPSCAAVVWR